MANARSLFGRYLSQRRDYWIFIAKSGDSLTTTSILRSYLSHPIEVPALEYYMVAYGIRTDEIV